MPSLTPDIIERRRGGIGGSDAPNVFDVGYSSPYGVWAAKIYGLEWRTTPFQQRGHDLEEMCAEKGARHHGISLDRLELGGWRDHPDHEWLFVNTDYEVDDLDTVLECKITDWRFKGEEWGPDKDPEGVPLYITIQVHQQMLVTGASRVVVCVLFVDTWQVRTYEIRRDESILQKLVAGEQPFWFDHVVARRPPPLTNSVDAWDALRMMCTDDKASVELKAETHDLIMQYVTAREDRLAMEKHEKDLRARLAWIMGDHEIGRIGQRVAVEFKSPPSGGSRQLKIPTSYKKEFANGHSTRT